MEKDEQTKDRDASDLILRKLNRQNRESNRKLANNGPYVAIDKKWIFDLLDARFAKSERGVNGRSEPNWRSG